MANFVGLDLDHRLEYMSHLSDFFGIFVHAFNVNSLTSRITFCMTHSMHVCMENLSESISSAVKGNDLTLNDSNEPEFTTLKLGGSEFQMNGELTKKWVPEGIDVWVTANNR